MFDGTFGDRPNKMTLALAALANGVKIANPDSRNYDALIFAFTHYMSEFEKNKALLRLNSVDEEIIQIAYGVFNSILPEIDRQQAELVV